MKTLEIKENLYYIGVIDHNLKVFDVAVRTDYGTSYNSYLLKTKDGAVLFEGVKKEFQEEYLKNIESLVPLNEVKYLVVTHTEPDHAGSIKALLGRNPDLTIVASSFALKNLDAILRCPFKRIAMNPNASLSIGEYAFSFYSGLMLHWPDVMFTYIKELKTFVSCDAFGAHFASDEVLLSKEKDQEGYHKALRYYFENIMGPFGKFVSDAIKRISSLDIEMICPGHGPIIDKEVSAQITIYDKLAKEVTPVNDPNRVCIVYASAYGYTRKMAEHLKERFEKDGKTVAFYEIAALNYALDKDSIIKDIYRSGMLLLGSPTFVGDAVSLFYDLLSSFPNTVAVGKKASAFGDYGWSGEAVKNLSERLSQLRFNVIAGFRYCFELDEEGWRGLDAYYDSLI